MKEASIPLEHIYNVPLRILDLAAPGLFRLPEVRTYKILESNTWPEKMTQLQAVGLASYKYRKAWKKFLGADKWEHFLLKRTGYQE